LIRICVDASRNELGEKIECKEVFCCFFEALWGVVIGNFEWVNVENEIGTVSGILRFAVIKNSVIWGVKIRILKIFVTIPASALKIY
jgi:hypothetical protein